MKSTVFILFLIITSQSALSEVIGYKYKMVDILGFVNSRCFEINQAFYSRKKEEVEVDDFHCKNVKPKTIFKWEKILNDKFSTCLSVDDETNGKLFKQITSNLDCESIKPKTKFEWIFGNRTSCREVDVETSGVKFFSHHHTEICKKQKVPQPKTKIFLQVNASNTSTSCIEHDIETNGKKFNLGLKDVECLSQKPKTSYEIRIVENRKVCYEVDIETKGKKYINRCTTFDPNPIAKELFKITEDQFASKGIFNGLLRSNKPKQNTLPNKKEAEGKSK